MALQSYHKNHSRVEYWQNAVVSYRRYKWSRTITFMCGFIFRGTKSTTKTVNNDPRPNIPTIQYNLILYTFFADLFDGRRRPPFPTVEKHPGCHPPPPLRCHELITIVLNDIRQLIAKWIISIVCMSSNTVQLFVLHKY